MLKERFTNLLEKRVQLREAHQGLQLQNKHLNHTSMKMAISPPFQAWAQTYAVSCTYLHHYTPLSRSSLFVLIRTHRSIYEDLIVLRVLLQSI